MSHALALKYLLKRGALLAAASWQVVVLQFLAEAVFKLLLVVPVIAAAFLVALLVGGSGVEFATADVRHTLSVLLAAFGEHPGAVIAYALGLFIIAAGGSAVTFLVKGGTVVTLVHADEQARVPEHLPLRLTTLTRAATFRLDRFMSGCGHLFRRYLTLGALLAAIYVVAAIGYLAAVFWTFRLVTAVGLFSAWTAVAAAISGVLVLAITMVNLLYLLLQIAIATDDVDIRSAASLVGELLRQQGSPVAVLFLTLLVVVGLATVGSILAMASLGFIGFIPVLGLAVFPLQIAAWIARGLIFQYLGLTALASYIHLYRTHRAGRRLPGSVAGSLVDRTA
jgi:hypothetical protein